PERDGQGDEQALGPANGQQELDPSLSGERPRPHGRSSLVKRRNTSSSEPRPACSSPRVTSRSRNQPARSAIRSGVAATAGPSSPARAWRTWPGSTARAAASAARSGSGGAEKRVSSAALAAASSPAVP